MPMPSSHLTIGAIALGGSFGVIVIADQIVGRIIVTPSGIRCLSKSELAAVMGFPPARIETRRRPHRANLR
jgi:hypothetical protein